MNDNCNNNGEKDNNVAVQIDNLDSINNNNKNTAAVTKDGEMNRTIGDFTNTINQFENKVPTTTTTTSSAVPVVQSSSNSFLAKVKKDPSILYKWYTESTVTKENMISVFVVIVAIMIPLRNTLIVQIVIHWLLHPFYHLCLRIIGVTIGVGLGLGLAAHVYDQLDAWKYAQEEEQQQKYSSMLYEVDSNGDYYSSDDDDDEYIEEDETEMEETTLDGTAAAALQQQKRRRRQQHKQKQQLRRRLKNFGQKGIKKLSPISSWIRDRKGNSNNNSSSSSLNGWDTSNRRLGLVGGTVGQSSSRALLQQRNNNNNDTLQNQNNYEDDEQTYSSLMKSAGYTFVYFTSSSTSGTNATSPTHVQQHHQQQQPRLRGQVIRSDNLNFQNRLYNFAETRISEYDNIPTNSNNNNNKSNDNDANSDNRSNDGGSKRSIMDLESDCDDNNSIDDESTDSVQNEDTFTISVPIPISKAVTCMNNMWPTLPTRINEELGRAIEYIVRDFIVMWFCKCDYGCVYDDPEVTLKDKKKKIAKASVSSRHNHNQQQQQRTRQQQSQVSGEHNNQQAQQRQMMMMNEYNYYYNKRMLYSMAQYRPLPFIDSLYDSMTIIFGNLATRVENINIFELVLLKWVQVLAHTFKVYRSLRKNVLKIQQQQQQTQTQTQPTRSSMALSTVSTTMGITYPTSTSISGSIHNETPINSSVSAISKAATQRVKNLRQTLYRIRPSSSSVLGGTTTTTTTDASETFGNIDSTTTSTSNDGHLDDVITMASSNHNTGTSSSTVAASRQKQPNQQSQQSSTTSSTSTSTQSPVPSKYIPVSEMSMTKEFLFAGKLHKAVTFGLDVKALLFSDSTGRDCGVPLTDDEKKTFGNTTTNTNNITNNNAIRLTDDDVLERRLFNTPLLSECELDYNRVLGHRIVRTLIPRADYSCLIVRNLLTEIMGGCVLNPIMSIFSPEYINSWIIAGLVSSSPSPSSPPPDTEQQTGTNNTSTNTNATTPDLVGEVVTMSTKQPPATITGTAADTTTSQSIDEQVIKPKNNIRPLDQIVIADRADDGTDTFEVQVNTTLDKDMSAPIVDGSKASIVSSNHPVGDNINSYPTQTTEVLETGSCDDGEQKYNEYEIQQQGHDTQQNMSVSAVDRIYTQLAMALIDLQRFVDFDEFRNSRTTNTPYKVDWDTPECRTAAIRLVLVIEAALSHGRCLYKPKASSNISIDSRSIDEYDEDDNDFNSIEGDALDTFDHGQSSLTTQIIDFPDVQLSQVLMELTSDMDAFEDKIDTLLELEDEKRVYEDRYSCMVAQSYQPSAQEQSTMRTLIAAWLHSGQSYRAISLLMKAQTTVLAPFYRHGAFLRSRDTSGAFLRQFVALVDVGILVDTMSVLGVPRLEDSDPELLASLMAKSAGTLHTFTNGQRLTDQTRSPSNVNSPLAASSQYTNSASTAIPRYLDFNRNESFAASLRTERERRQASWERLMHEEIYGAEGYNEPLPIICSAVNRNDEEQLVLHRELHHLARIFYTGTNMIAIRDASRRKSNPTPIDGIGDASVESSSIDDLQQVSLVTVETACPRRRLEVPDDDSSFLLRAQPRPLNAVGVHRDQRNHDQSFKCFASTYDEPALPAAPGHYTGGRYIRRCLVRYYPIDRTATVSLPTEAARKLDQRKNNASIPDVITVGQSLLSSGRPAPFLSAEFLRDRHFCQRWVPKGTTRSQSILASNVMEATDFTSIPRSGKAIDFVYRSNFYERPMLDLSGKHFTVHDSASLGTHRADASALELTDATISLALMLLGQSETTIQSESGTVDTPTVEMGKDGYPVVWMKFSRKQDNTHVEVKPYRTSFVRAALMITAARQEAQLQGLIKCVKDGSAKQASKALTDATLKQTIKLLEYATSRSREKQSLLQRDLKLGVNHIDRGQLRRNGLLLPRYPTTVLEFSAFVEDVVQSAEVKGVVNIFGSSTTVFRIKCSATVTLAASDDELEGDLGYRAEHGQLGEVFQEEWVIYRTMKEFQTLHKHLKNEVSAAESSGTASSRLVGAATAAFSVTNAIQVPGRQRQKKILIPSLSQASKAGALGVTRKLNAKRKEILEGYLSYLLSPRHLVGQCTELLLFLGAFYPFPSHARVGVTVPGDSDPLGRTEMIRTIIKLRPQELGTEYTISPLSMNQLSRRGANRTVSTTSIRTTESIAEDDEVTDDGDEPDENNAGKIEMIPSIKSKIDRVHLSDVRNKIFELVRYQFGFENASFIRNRMLQALKTVTFAVASPSEFRKMLYKAHLDYINGDAVAGWIKLLSDLLWPEGVFFTSSPPTTPDELKKQAKDAKEALHSSFPAEVRTILGQDLTRDGMDILFEMLQNRMVLKSMAYMLFDLLWLEVFPELGDILTGGLALDIDPKTVS